MYSQILYLVDKPCLDWLPDLRGGKRRVTVRAEAHFQDQKVYKQGVQRILTG